MAKHLGRAGGEFLVDSGIVGAGENVADAMDRSTAINATLAQQGVTGEWAVLKHIMQKASEFNFNRERLREYEDFLARQSGWDGGDPLKKHAEELGGRREQMEAIQSLPNTVPRDKHGMPIHPPLPTPRPMSPADEARAAQVWAAGYDRLASARTGESASKAAGRHAFRRTILREQGPAVTGDANFDDFQRAATMDAGRDAGRAFREEAAQAANEIGENGGSAFNKMLSGMAQQIGRQIGAAAASEIKAARVTVDRAPVVNADTGRSNGGVRTGPQ